MLSCSSDDSDPAGNTSSGYYFRFKLNGTQKDYSETVNLPEAIYLSYADYPLENGLKETRLFAAKEFTNPGIDALLIDLYHNSNLQTNTNYANYGSSAMTLPELFVLGVYDDNGMMYYTNNEGWNGYYGGENNAVVRFDEITSNTLKGTFSGTLYSAAGSGENITVTDGEFYIRRSPL